MASRKPQTIANVLAELMARRGYARLEASAALTEAWRALVGDSFAAETRVGAVRRGVLEVAAAHSTLVQELTFQRHTLIAALAKSVPDQKITGLRFQVAPFERP